MANKTWNLTLITSEGGDVKTTVIEYNSEKTCKAAKEEIDFVLTAPRTFRYYITCTEK